MATPSCTISVNESSLAISQITSTSAGGMPPPASGPGARRVHSTPPFADGSPLATPSVNGSAGSSIGASVVVVGLVVVVAVTVVVVAAVDVLAGLVVVVDG